MLVLTRKMDQQIHLGDQITITVLRVRGNTIRLGIEAPREMRIVRGELPPLEKTDDSNDGSQQQARVPQPKASAASPGVRSSSPKRFPASALKKTRDTEPTAVSSPLADFVKGNSQTRQEAATESVLVAS